MSPSLYAKFTLILFASIFLLGTVWSILIYPITGISVVNVYDLKRFLVLGFIGIAALALLPVKTFLVAKLSKPTWMVVGLFFVLGIVSALLSKQPYWGLVEMANYALLFAAFLILSICFNALDKTQVYSGIYYTLLIFSVFLFANFCWQWLFHFSNKLVPNVHGLISGFDNVRFFNQLQVMIFPLLCMPFFTEKLKQFQRISLFFLGFHWLVLLQSEARGAILSIVIASSLFCYFASKTVRQRLIDILWRSCFMGLLLWVIFILLLPYLITQQIDMQLRTSSSGRLGMWWYLLKSVPENLWLGHGPMSFMWAEGKPISTGHPHNSVLQLLYEHGILVFAPLMTLAITLFWQELKQLKKQAEFSTEQLTLLAIISGMIYSLFSGVIVMPMAQIILIGLLALKVGQRAELMSDIRQKFTAAFVLVVGLLILSLSYYIYTNTIVIGYPRFLLHGF